MEKTLEFTQYGGGRYACTFTAAGGKSLIQVIRQKQGLIYIEAGADTEHLTYLESAGRFKDVLCEIEVPAETVVRVVSHTPVEYAAYMAGEEGKSGDYYTKEEIDRMMASITQLQADWNQTDPEAADYIKGKPTLVERLEDLSDVEISPVDMSQQNYFEDAAEDYDGNLYDAVIIGDQVWLASNLRTTHYADGTPIANLSNSIGWSECHETTYVNTAEYEGKDADTYGLNYQLHNSGKDICPPLFHIPSAAEFLKLENTNIKRYCSNFGWQISNVVDSPGYNQSDNNLSQLNITPTTSSNTVPFGASAEYLTSDNKLFYIDRYSLQYQIVDPSSQWPEFHPNAVFYAIRCVCDLTATEFRAKMGKRATKGQHLEFDGEIWRNKNTGLPDVTESDNGDALVVDEGAWRTGKPRDNRIPAITPAKGSNNSDDWTKIMAVNQAGNGFELVYPGEVIDWHTHHYGGGEVQITFTKRYKNTCIITSEEEDFSLNILFDTTADCYLFIKNRANHKIHFTVNRIQYGSYIDVPLKKVTEGVLENGVDIEAGGFCLIRAKMVVDMAIIDVMNQPVANPNFTHTANTTVSDPTATITFPAYRRCTQMITVSADLGVTLEVNNQSDNYLWIKNNSNSDVDITITAVTHGGNSVSNIYMPADGIIVPANGVCEIGILVNTDGAFISSRNDLTLQQ